MSFTVETVDEYAGFQPPETVVALTLDGDDPYRLTLDQARQLAAALQEAAG